MLRRPVVEVKKGAAGFALPGMLKYENNSYRMNRIRRVI